MPLLEALMVSKSFGGLQALVDVDLTLERGELVGLIGPNGAGKSTFINLLSGYYAPSSGRIVFDGEEITGKKIYEVAKRGLVRSFQQSVVFREFTVLQNGIIGHHIFERPGLFEGLFSTRSYRQKESDYRRKAEEAIEFAGLHDYRDEPAGALPYGSQRLLGIAIAASANPKVLLLDEPLAGMNPEEGTSALQLVERIRKEKNTGVLLIEHNVRAVMAFCQRVVVLNFGRTIAEGTPKEVSDNRAVIDAYLGDEVHAA